MPLPENWPPHEFNSGGASPRTLGSDPICRAWLETGRPDEHGYSHHSECGQPRSAHEEG